MFTLHSQVGQVWIAMRQACDEVQPDAEMFASWRLVGEKHLALKLKHQGHPVDGIWFGRTEQLPRHVKLAFRLDADEWQGQRRVRFLVEGAQG